jgi:general transcription factor 3C polypeptide 3 (transcription factor C subunit 4)
LFDQALRYYEPLQFTEEYADIGFFLAIGDCAFACGKNQEAASYYMTVVENDSTHLQARVNLAKLYEELGDKERALYFVNQAVLLGREEAGGRRRTRRRDPRIANLAREFQGTNDLHVRNVAPRLSNVLAQSDVSAPDTDRPGHVQYLYSKMNELRPVMRGGDENATEDWLDIADALLRDFRSNRSFYPLQKNTAFLGYAREAQKKGAKKKEDLVMDEMQEMAGRLQESLSNIPEERIQATVPTDYYGISFADWLEIFLEYAFVVSGQGDSEEAYNVLAAAADASIWYHSKDKTRHIHICWISEFISYCS